ncbi:unnamed protein product, partial [Adineta steineri]
MNANNDNNQQSKIKCHGNRRDQRFRRKCRKRGMEPAEIKKLLERNQSKQSTTTATTHLNKRKRNISLQELKAKRPMYLQRSSWILFQTLKIGRTEHHWPEEVQLLSKTNDYELCFQYLTNYIEQLNEQINQYEKELATQLSSYSMIPISVNQVDTCLKEYVNHQRQYLVTKNSNQLAKLQDEILANKLYETIMTSYPSLNPNQFIDQLISIRQKQTQLLEELLQLEMRILYKFLPSDLDQEEKIVALIAYIPLNNKRYKMIQDAKRQW